VYVAKYFVENSDPVKYNVVDHIDGDKLNNNYINLRWTNQSGNMMNYHSKKIYTGKEIIQYTKNMTATVKNWKNIKVLVEQTGYNYKSVMCAIANKNSFDGFMWIYKNSEYDYSDLEGEEWKDITNISGEEFLIYSVSTHGRVKNKKRNKYIKTTTVSGYYQLILNNKKSDRITLKVHRIVAEVFVGEKIRYK